MATELFPQIDIDHNKCTTPFACKQCLQICPTAVLSVHATKMVRMQVNDKHEAGTYKLAVKFRDKCTGCNLCMDVCPVDALNVYLPELAS
jgi:ferredoxin